MAVMREIPYGNYNFLVDLGTGDTTSPQAGFKEVLLPEAVLGMIEYRSGNQKENDTVKMVGLEHYSNLILKRGFIGTLDLYMWWDQVRNGDWNSLRNITVQLLDEDRSQTVLTWKFRGCRPVRYTFSGLEGQGNEVLVEIMEITFNRMEME